MKNYITAVPNVGAGIGHQISNWISGKWFADQFTIEYAHYKFKSPHWDKILGFGRGLMQVEELLNSGYSRIDLPIFRESNNEQMDMLEEMRLAYVAYRAEDVTLSPDLAWSWLENSFDFIPECRNDQVTWNYDHSDSPWHVAFTPGMRAIDVRSHDGAVLLQEGQPTRVDLSEVRRKAAEAAERLFSKL
jgi:hypothetical protein